MAVKLRLARAGTHKRPFYWIVAADARMPRDGRFLEKLGTYNPKTSPPEVQLKSERIHHWLDKGAQPTPPVRELLRNQGILRARAEAKAHKKPGQEAPSPESAGE